MTKEHLCRVKYVVVQGTKYALGYILLCYIEEEDDMPVFGKINDIIIKPQLKDTLFVLQPYRASSFNYHFHSYEVSPVDDVLIYKQTELADYHPLSICKSFTVSSSMFVRLKYHV